MWSGTLAVVLLSAAVVSVPRAALARVGGGQPEDACLSGEGLEFGAGSTRLDHVAAAKLDDAAAWIASGAGRYAFLAVPDEAVEPLGPARARVAADHLAARGIDPQAVRATSMAVLDPQERPALAGSAVVVKLCAGPAPYVRDWTLPPAGDGVPRQGLGRATLVGVLLGLWIVGPVNNGPRF
jgi:hypothetical protein